MKRLMYLFVLLIIFSTSSCSLFDEEHGLTTAEIIEGLKTALEIGADTATTKLSVTDGYYADDVVKILLPEEADIIYDNLDVLDNWLPSGRTIIENKLEDLVLAVNRSAEDAADDALPILKNAITGLTITDGLDILEGSVPNDPNPSPGFDSLAATHYLEIATKSDLVIIFSEPMNNSLQTPLVGGISAYSLWEDITSTYNTAVELYNLVPFQPDLETVDTDLGEYVTQKAMDGLFIKVGEEEKNIRRDPFQWGIDILERVFGYDL
ncbi:MAG: DUF4197 domain-containing protein [Bacteroidales bacterium]|nr:DUF4197 domain-containing protein [Bacteroidales bacterium]